MPYKDPKKQRAAEKRYRKRNPAYRKRRGYATLAQGLAAQRRIYARKKAYIDAHKAHEGCQDCGERDVRCLDLHHRDPQTKHPKLKRGHKQGIVQLSWEAIRAEIAKCDVLCANCHRKRRPH